MLRYLYCLRDWSCIHRLPYVWVARKACWRCTNQIKCKFCAILLLRRLQDIQKKKKNCRKKTRNQNPSSPLPFLSALTENLGSLHAGQWFSAKFSAENLQAKRFVLPSEQESTSVSVSHLDCMSVRIFEHWIHWKWQRKKALWRLYFMQIVIGPVTIGFFRECAPSHVDLYTHQLSISSHITRTTHVLAIFFTLLDPTKMSADWDQCGCHVFLKRLFGFLPRCSRPKSPCRWRLVVVVDSRPPYPQATHQMGAASTLISALVLPVNSFSEPCFSLFSQSRKNTGAKRMEIFQSICTQLESGESCGQKESHAFECH